MSRVLIAVSFFLYLQNLLASDSHDSQDPDAGLGRLALQVAMSDTNQEFNLPGGSFHLDPSCIEELYKHTGVDHIDGSKGYYAAAQRLAAAITGDLSLCKGEDESVSLRLTTSKSSPSTIFARFVRCQ